MKSARVKAPVNHVREDPLEDAEAGCVEAHAAEWEALDLAELVCGEGCCPAAKKLGVIIGHDHDEGGVLVVDETALIAKLTTDLKEAWSTRLVEDGEMDSTLHLRSQDEVKNVFAQFRRKLKEVRLPVEGVEGVGSSLVLRCHGVAGLG